MRCGDCKHFASHADLIAPMLIPSAEQIGICNRIQTVASPISVGGGPHTAIPVRHLWVGPDFGCTYFQAGKQ